MGPAKNKYADLSTKVVERKAFLITLSVQGHLDSLGNATLASQVEGTTTIISIVPEGTLVEKGDLVCELDASLLREKSKQQEITVSQADSAEVQGKEALEITRTQSLSDISAAELKLKLAKLDLTKFIEGEFPQQEHELEGSVEIAREEQIRAKETYDFTKQQVKKGYRTQNEMEANRIAVLQADLKVKGAMEKLGVLQKYDKERKSAELEANAKELALELERVKLKSTSAETQALKDYEAKKLTGAVEHEKLDRLNRQIEACRLVAPQAGQVVYANIQSSGSSRSNGEVIEQGASVRERQAIINLPDITRMKVDCRIHESLIGNVRVDLPAKIKIDAFPDRMFKGAIASVSSVPMTGRWPNTDLREYQTGVKLIDEPEVIQMLRPGLTAQVEILIDNRENILQIPVQAVLAVADKHIAFVLTEQGEEHREIVVGQSNQSHVEIKEGLQEGERVIMNARSQFPDKIASIESQLNAERVTRATTEKIPAIPAAPATPTGPVASGSPVGPEAKGGDRGAVFTEKDKNGDGKLTGDEIDERMQSRLKEIDKDADGAISKEEFLSAPRWRG